MQKAVFVDRDGTLIVDRGYLADPAGVELLSGVTDGLLALQEAGFLLVLVTNQSGVGRGLFPLTAIDAQHRQLAGILDRQGINLAGIEVCPHRPEDGCECRKPRPGMLLRAAKRLEIDTTASFMVGDRCTDVQAGAAVGCQTVFLGTKNDCPTADACAPGFSAAAAWILGCQPPALSPER